MRKKVIIPKQYDFLKNNSHNFDYFSYSTINIKCPYEFYLKKIKMIKQEDNVYTAIGSLIHNILEDYYSNKINKKEMIDEFQLQFVLIMKTYIFKLDVNENKKMMDNYYNDLLHFFKHHKLLKGKKVIEQLVYININNKHLLIGYIDLLSREGKTLVITDWKSSKIYTKPKQKEYAEQLMLYALGVSQNFGVSINQIKIRWNFVRYVKVSYTLLNGKRKTTFCERHSWVEKMSTQIKRKMKYYGYDSIETSYLITQCIQDNSLKHIADKVQQEFILSEAYVYYEINKDDINDLKNEVEGKCDLIIDRGDEELAWRREEKLSGKDTFYCNVLCGVRKHCFYYKDYLEKENFYTKS